ncbi:MAG: ABC transporter permease [Christensenellales bacterium]|jgi:putative aldouronate transport system permease protein
MTVATAKEANRASSDLKKYLIALLSLLTLACLFLTFISGVHYKTEEPQILSGIDFLLGRTAGKSGGTPHPLIVGVLIFGAWSVLNALIQPDKFLYSIISSVFLIVSIAMFRFDVVYQAKSEFALDASAVGIGIGWALALALAICNFAAIIWRKSSRTLLLRKQELDRIYASANIPGGYKVLSTKEIIARDFCKHWPIYLMVLPTLIFYFVWCYGPMYGIIIAFNDFAPKRGILGSKWVGLQWFRDFFRSPFAWRTIRNTLFISFYNLLFGFPAPIILALMLNEMHSIKFKRVAQTITYMPYFISLVVMCGILTDFCSTTGLFAQIQYLFGADTAVNLLGDAKYFRSVYVGSEIWQKLGWDSIIYLSALSAIDQEQYEAATIDGAGKFKQVLHVTIPGIMPTISILLILRIGALMGIGYEKIILLYNGLTYETADVVSTYVYRKGIVDANFSFSTAVNLFNSIINFLLVVFANKMSSILTENSLW